MNKMIVAFSVFLCATTMAWAADAPLNPQPLPPGARAHNNTATPQVQSPRDPCVQSHSATNNKNDAQLPPGHHKTTASACTPNGQSSGSHRLNPQPLPPG
ncbi:MAG: hypothetical protein WCA81_04145 [Rhizomicrobium sp.]